VCVCVCACVRACVAGASETIVTSAVEWLGIKYTDNSCTEASRRCTGASVCQARPASGPGLSASLLFQLWFFSFSYSCHFQLQLCNFCIIFQLSYSYCFFSVSISVIVFLRFTFSFLVILHEICISVWKENTITALVLHCFITKIVKSSWKTKRSA